MRHAHLVTCIVLAHFTIAAGQVIFQEPLSPRNANYKMEVALDVEKKQITGHQILTWRNITNRPTDELQLHLYMNAFKNNQSTFFKESRSGGGLLAKEKAWGWIDIRTIRILNGVDLTEQMEFIHPDDDNADDRTVARIPLPSSIRPGQEIHIEIDFVTQLPRVYRRNGYYKDYFFAAQWFPKVGVLEEDGWNCHQYHANSEFFSDYGVYDVSITLPKPYVVGSTGQLQETLDGEHTKTLRFWAEDVHDFTWTSWPHYRTARMTHRDVEVTLLYDQDHASSVDRYMDSMRKTLDFFSDWIGDYPYPCVTVIDPPTGCFDVAGMEYPMLFTGGAFWKMPSGALMTEMVTIHEFGHNFWYGIVGNNEFEEAWLDEGINSYTECRIMDACFGDETSILNLPGLRAGELAYQRLSYIGLTRYDRTLRDSWTYIAGGYGAHSYSKPALMLWTLENIIGRETMDRIMRTYFQRWKFRHPKSRDYIDVVNEVTGQDYAWFFDQFLSGSLELDYRVSSVWTGRNHEAKGFFDKASGRTLLPNDAASKDDEEDLYRSIVKIHRKGEAVVPVDILLTFEDGDTLRQTWDGEDRWFKIDVKRPAKLTWAAVDPDHKLVLDACFANNSRTVKSQNKAVDYITVRFLYWTETLLHLVGFFG